MRTELLSVCAAADYSICVILPTSPTALDRPPISDSIPAHIGTYALAERGDEGAHIAGYALPECRESLRLRDQIAGSGRWRYCQRKVTSRFVMMGLARFGFGVLRLQWHRAYRGDARTGMATGYV